VVPRISTCSRAIWAHDASLPITAIGATPWRTYESNSDSEYAEEPSPQISHTSRPGRTIAAPSA